MSIKSKSKSQSKSQSKYTRDEQIIRWTKEMVHQFKEQQDLRRNPGAGSSVEQYYEEYRNIRHNMSDSVVKSMYAAALLPAVEIERLKKYDNMTAEEYNNARYANNEITAEERDANISKYLRHVMKNAEETHAYMVKSDIKRAYFILDCIYEQSKSSIYHITMMESIDELIKAFQAGASVTDGNVIMQRYLDEASEVYKLELPMTKHTKAHVKSCLCKNR